MPRWIVCADDVSRGKPHPEPYLTAASLVGYPPQRCLAIEDAQAGVEAARAAGMQVLGITTTMSREELGVPCVRDFEELRVRVDGALGDCDCYNGIGEWDNPSEYGIMTTKLTLDKAGRVVLPKPLRDELELAAGDTLELESRGEQITLRPVRGTVPLQKERGIWVYRTGRPLTAATTDQTLRQIREERDRENRKAR